MIVQATNAQAQRLLRNLALPEEARKVLYYGKYWSGAFCIRYFEACDSLIFEDPRAGLKAAEVAPLLVKRTEARHCGGAQRRRELLVKAWSILGSAHRALGHLDAAERSYSRAGAIRRIAPLTYAEMIRRITVLRIDQRRFEEAHELISEAIAIYKEECHEEARSRELGQAYIIRGAIQLEARDFSPALRAFSKALTFIDPKKHPRFYYCAVQNLVDCVTRQGGHPDDIAEAMTTVAEAYRHLKLPARSLPKLKLRWLEGIAAGKLGLTRHQERRLVRARAGLVDLELPYEVASISLDLSALYLEQRRFRDLSRLARETYTLFTSLAVDREALAAVLLWVRAARGRRLSSELLEQTRGVLAAREQASRRAGSLRDG